MVLPRARFMPNPDASVSAATWHIDSGNLDLSGINRYVPRKGASNPHQRETPAREISVRDADAKAELVPTKATRITPVVMNGTGQGEWRSGRITPDSYPLLAPADARRLAYWRRIFTWLPQPSMLHQRRLAFLLPS